MEQLTAIYGLGNRSPAGLIIMEQLDWMPYVGGLSRFAMATYLAGLIYDSEIYQPYYDCGVVDGRYQTIVYVYPLVAGLNYQAYLSYGELGERRVEMAEMQESVQVKLNTSFDIKYLVDEIISYEWQGDCYDRDLAVVPAPVLRVSSDRRSIMIGAEVYGTVNLKYRTERHTYSVAVTRREEAAENRYSSTCFCVYDGGPPEHLVLSPPPGAEEFDGDCAEGGGGNRINPPPDPDPDWPDPHADRNTVYDWCDKHLISDTTTGV